MHNEYINIVIIRKYIEIRYVSYIIQYKLSLWNLK